MVSVSGETGCLPIGIREAALLGQHEQVVKQSGVDPELAVLLSLDIPSCGNVYYVPVENDTLGLGYQHTEGTELFDQSPGTELQGLIFLNDLTYWEENPEELSEIFLHEVGHRWGARVRMAGEEGTQLLGRDARHWSAFLDSARSPLEGNSWEANSSTTSSHETIPQFSQLDLYLMGQLRPSEVGPLRRFAAEEPERERDCTGHPLSASSPPQDCGPLRLNGHWQEFSVDDIIAVEGSRMPALGPSELRIGFYLAAPAQSAWSQAACLAWDARVHALLRDFRVATGGRMTLTLITDDGDCEEVLQFLGEGNRAAQEQERSAQAGGCVSARATEPRPSLGWCLLALLICSTARGRRSPRHRKM